MVTLKKLAGGALLALASLAAAAPAPAQEYPSRYLRLIVPFAAGGPVDIIGRIVAKELGDALGQSVVVENRPGASGLLGTQQAIQSPPDGYTLLLGSTSTISILPAMEQAIKYDPVRELAPVGLVATGMHIFVVNPKLPVDSMQELIAYIKRQPVPLNAASGGNGTPDDLALHLFEREAGVKLTHIQYRGTGPALLDVVTGQVPLGAADISSVIGFIRGGQLKALGIASQERNPLLPELATTREQGLNGIQSGGWFGVFAPAGTPPAIVKLLSDRLEAAMQTPEARDRVQRAGITPLSINSGAAAERVQQETAKWGKLIKDNKLKLD